MSFPDRPPGEPTTDRLAGESSVAYLAYCQYRDFGPTRSLEKAWRDFAAATAKTAAKRSTAWDRWSSKYQWVKRSAVYDAEIEALKRTVRLAKIAALEERRAEYEFAEQERLERRVAKMELVLDKADAAPITDVTQAKDETAKGRLTRTKTKVKGINFAGYASFAKVINQTAERAITGVREKTEKDAAGHNVKNLVFRGTPA